MKQMLRNTLSILTADERKRLGVFIILNVFISLIDIASLALLVLLILLDQLIRRHIERLLRPAGDSREQRSRNAEWQAKGQNSLTQYRPRTAGKFHVHLPLKALSERSI